MTKVHGLTQTVAGLGDVGGRAHGERFGDPGWGVAVWHRWWWGFGFCVGHDKGDR